MNFFEQIFDYANLFIAAEIGGAIILLGLLVVEMFIALGQRRAPLLVLIGVPLLCANAAYNLLSGMAWDIQMSVTIAHVAAVILGGAAIAFAVSFFSVRT